MSKNEIVNDNGLLKVNSLVFFIYTRRNAMKNFTSTLLLSLLFLGCMGCNDTEVIEGTSPVDLDAPYGCYDPGHENGALPDYLVIGDSISIDYTRPLRDNFRNQLEVVHNLCNARWSTSGVERIDMWLDQRENWELITFNHGLWDAAQFVRTSDEDYEAALRIIGQKIKAAAPRYAFILTTGLPDGEVDGTGRTDVKIQSLNVIATRVMNELNIPIIDLYSFSNTIESEHTFPNNVHFTQAGSVAQANFITSELKRIYSDL